MSGGERLRGPLVREIVQYCRQLNIKEYINSEQGLILKTNL